MKETIEIEELKKVLWKVEEEGRQIAWWADSSSEQCTGYGMMDSIQRIKNELKIE